MRFQLGFQLGFLLGALGYVGTYVSTNIPIDQRNVPTVVAFHHSCVFIHDIGLRCVSKGGLRFATTHPTDGCRGSASASLPRTPAGCSHSVVASGVQQPTHLTCAADVRWRLHPVQPPLGGFPQRVCRVQVAGPQPARRRVARELARPPGRPARGERPGPHRPPAEHRPQPPLSPREHRRPEGLPARDGRGGVARTAPRRGFWCYMPTTIATARTPTTCATARTPTTPRTPGGTASTERGTPDDDPEAPRYREATAKMRHSPCVDAALLEFKS